MLLRINQFINKSLDKQFKKNLYEYMQQVEHRKNKRQMFVINYMRTNYIIKKIIKVRERKSYQNKEAYIYMYKLM